MSDPAVPLYFEDLVPGRLIDLGAATISGELIDQFAALTGDRHPIHVDVNFASERGFSDRLAHGTLVIATAIGQLIASSVMNDSLIAMTDLQWRFRRPVYAGQTITFSMEITNRRLHVDATRGVVGRRFEVRDEQGVVLQEGQSEVVVTVRDAAAAMEQELSSPSFGSAAWVTRLSERLSNDVQFEAATSTFDGAISLRFNNDSCALRIYRGRVIDSGRAVGSNATFTVGAAYSDWLDFARRPRNEFISFAMADRFTISGSTYEYLRMTRATMIATDHVRMMLAPSESAVVRV